MVNVTRLLMCGAEFVGRVVSNRVTDTISVSVQYVAWIPRYKVYQKRTKRFLAHDESNSCNIGDIVRIRSCKKIADNKAYMLTEVVKRSDVYQESTAAALSEARDAQASVPDWVELAKERLQKERAKLEAVRAQRAMEEQAAGSPSDPVAAIMANSPRALNLQATTEPPGGSAGGGGSAGPSAGGGSRGTPAASPSGLPGNNASAAVDRPRTGVASSSRRLPHAPPGGVVDRNSDDSTIRPPRGGAR